MILEAVKISTIIRSYLLKVDGFPDLLSNVSLWDKFVSIIMAHTKPYHDEIIVDDIHNGITNYVISFHLFNNASFIWAPFY